MKPFCAGYIQMECLVLQVFARCEVITEWPDYLVSFHFVSCRYQTLWFHFTSCLVDIRLFGFISLLVL